MSKPLTERTFNLQTMLEATDAELMAKADHYERCAEQMSQPGASTYQRWALACRRMAR